nr:hypothetical protein Iba_chr09aCG14210 [Ipomoea batatas]
MKLYSLLQALEEEAKKIYIIIREGGLDESIQLFVPYKTMTAEEAAALKADALPVPTSLCLRHWCRN